MNLTDAEYLLLNKIARNTRTDCWFFIGQDSRGRDFVKDLEENRILPLRIGVDMLLEAVNCAENFKSCHLTDAEETTLLTLTKRLKIPFRNPNAVTENSDLLEA